MRYARVEPNGRVNRMEGGFAVRAALYPPHMGYRL